jgi:hypothetical protein
MQEKIIPILFVIFGAYSTTIGFLNLKKNKKILSVFELVDLYIIKTNKGKGAYESRKDELLETSKHKIFAKYFLFIGIITAIIGFFLLLQ